MRYWKPFADRDRSARWRPSRPTRSSCCRSIRSSPTHHDGLRRSRTGRASTRARAAARTVCCYPDRRRPDRGPRRRDPRGLGSRRPACQRAPAVLRPRPAAEDRRRRRPLSGAGRSHRRPRWPTACPSSPTGGSVTRAGVGPPGMAEAVHRRRDPPRAAGEGGADRRPSPSSPSMWRPWSSWTTNTPTWPKSSACRPTSARRTPGRRPAVHRLTLAAATVEALGRGPEPPRRPVALAQPPGECAPHGPRERGGNCFDLLRGLHIIAVIAWMSGMMYLPRLYAYHTETAPPGSEIRRPLPGHGSASC